MCFWPWFPADVGEGADASAVELVAASRPHNLKVERLVELSQFIRHEFQPQRHLSVRRYNPPECTQSKTIHIKP